MDKVIIFGAGSFFKKCFDIIEEEFDVVAISDNNSEQKEKIFKDLFINPENIKGQEYDYILICCVEAFSEVQQQLLSYGIDRSKIKSAQKVLTELEVQKYQLTSYVMIEEGTSASDTLVYRALCRAAAENSEVFNVFKKSLIYTTVLEHVTQAQGQEYLKVIKENRSHSYDISDWENFQANDLYGNPKMYEYFIETDVKIWISPTTIRYAKILQDIVTLFDYKQIKSIAEIGVGYGGQARLIMSYLPIQQYYLIDLPDVLELSDVFLSKFLEKDRIVLCDGTKPVEKREYDFLISNYAFSELTREVQEMYMQSVVLNSRAGYMIWNDISNRMYGGYSVEELLQKIPGSKVYDEIPLTGPKNKLIIWGN